MDHADGLVETRRVVKPRGRWLRAGAATTALVGAFLAGMGVDGWVSDDRHRGDDDEASPDRADETAADDTDPTVAGEAPDVAEPEDPLASGEAVMAVAVFMERNVTQSRLDDVVTLLDDHPDVAQWRYLDHEASMAEFRRIFAHDEEMLQRAAENPDLVLTSYRVILNTKDGDVADALTRELLAQPGVFEVTQPITDTGTLERL